MSTDKSRHRGRFVGTQAQAHWGMCTWICTRSVPISWSLCVLVLSLFSSHFFFSAIYVLTKHRTVCWNLLCKKLTWPGPFSNGLIFQSIVGALLQTGLQNPARELYLSCQFSGLWRGRERGKKKDKKTVEESEEGCVKTSWTPWGFKRGNSAVVCEQPPPVHLPLRLCVCVLACAYVRVCFFLQSYQSTTRLLMAWE